MLDRQEEKEHGKQRIMSGKREKRDLGSEKKTTTRKISQQGNGSKVKLAKYKNDIKTSNREHQRKAPVRESQDAAKCPESTEEETR